MVIISLYFGAVLFVIGILSFEAWERRKYFRMSEYNPFRRFCKLCEQKQEYHQWNWAQGTGWWEDIGTVYAKDCECHRFSTYKD